MTDNNSRGAEETPNMFSYLRHSEKDDSGSNGGPTPNTAQNPPTYAAAAVDGATLEVVRRRRGRPSGSKNKPKSPVYLARQPELAVRILEIPSGNDVVQAISLFSRHRNIGLSVLSASGSVYNPSVSRTSTAPPIIFPGRYDILSISGTLVSAQQTPAIANGFSVILAGPQGNIVTGWVVNGLMAAGTVFVTVVSFNNPSSYLRLPSEEHVQGLASIGGGENGHVPVESSGMSMYSLASNNVNGHVPVESSGMSMYSLASNNVTWPPTARQPPPPPF